MLLKSVDADINVDNAKLLAQARANGGYGGKLDGSVSLTASGNKEAALKINVKLAGLPRRPPFGGDNVRDEEVPPVSLAADITATVPLRGNWHQARSGSLLFSMGPGKTRKGALGMFGGDVIGQLFSKLNPFAKEDPFPEVDCTVARIDILNGKATIVPVLLQTRKVTVAADGTVDLLSPKRSRSISIRGRAAASALPALACLRTHSWNCAAHWRTRN